MFLNDRADQRSESGPGGTSDCRAAHRPSSDTADNGPARRSIAGAFSDWTVASRKTNNQQPSARQQYSSIHLEFTQSAKSLFTATS
jgi:hypothetical protein